MVKISTSLYFSLTLLRCLRLMACDVRLLSGFNVFNVRTLWSVGWTFRQYFCTV